MSKSEKVFNWLLIGIFAILFVCIKQVAADPANSYGEAQFYNPVHIPRDNIRGRWLLDPGMNGDFLSSDGSVEEWNGAAELLCSDCPVGANCNCINGGDVTQETTEIYDFNSSAKLEATGFLHSIVAFPVDFSANTAYQIQFCYKGASGTEDVGWGAGSAAFTESYDFAADVWSGALTMNSALNIGTAWTCVNSYLTVGASEKTSYVIAFAPATADGTFIYIDRVLYRELHTPGVVGERGNILSVPVTSDPVFGSSPLLQHKPGAGQVTERGMKLDGVDDFVSRADDDTFDPSADSGHFSVGCKIINRSAGAGSVINKWGAAGQNAWALSQDPELYCHVTDGVDTSSRSSGIVPIAGVENVQVCIYQQVADGSSILTNVVNNSTVSMSTAVAPVVNSNQPLRLGATGYAVDGEITFEECTYWNRPLSAVEANKYTNPYFPGSNHGDGFYVDTCSQAASHATCTLDSCRDGTPAACQAEGTGAFAAFGQYTELVNDNSFETFTGDDSAPTFTNWTTTEVPGDGTSSITAYRAEKIHGEVAIRGVLTGTTAQARWNSACDSAAVGVDFYLYAMGKKFAGTTDSRVRILEYSDGDCNDYITVTNIWAGQLSETWNTYGGLFAAGSWDGTAASYIIQINETCVGGCDVLWDAVSAKAASYRTPFVHNVGAGTTTYNARDYRLHNPLSDRSDVLREDMYESGFCASAWIYTDWVADGIEHNIFGVPGTAGNNNSWRLAKFAVDKLELDLYDSAGSYKLVQSATITDTSWTAGDFKYIEVCSSNTGTLAGHWYNVSNATWYVLSTSGGPGTGIQDGQHDELHIGHTGGASSLDGYFSTINVGPYNAIFPLEGFNSGKPPINGRPY